MEIKVIRSWKDLEEYGIGYLTAESCAYSLRLLCDLTFQGMNIIRDFFGSNIEIKEGTNWNSKVKENIALASIMLPRSIFVDLAKFCLLREGYTYVHEGDRGWEGPEIYGSDKDLREQPMIFKIQHTIMNPMKSRNVHQFTGREV